MMYARITWDDNNDDELGHRIYRSLSPMDITDMPPAVAELGPDVTEWTDTDVAPGTTYYYRVSAYTAAEEAFSEEVQASTASSLQPPTNVVVTLEDVVPPEPIPTVIGEEIGGGFYIGNVTVADGGADDGEYAVIMGGPESQPGTLQWKTENTITAGTTSTEDGMANTLAMEAAGLAVHPAASYCRGYAGDGHDDWYLPARSELALAWTNRAQLAALAMEAQIHWSSTQFSANGAWYVDFSNGTQNYSSSKSSSVRVRPARRIRIPQE